MPVETRVHEFVWHCSDFLRFESFLLHWLHVDNLQLIPFRFPLSRFLSLRFHYFTSLLFDSFHFDYPLSIFLLFFLFLLNLSGFDPLGLVSPGYFGFDSIRFDSCCFKSSPLDSIPYDNLHFSSLHFTSFLFHSLSFAPFV